ncbi:MAG: L-histidine N(alpha)-methyltransferase [Verrucomicrobia subdivision 3 bacterium]|nr:L-histidine N(alpha)-methyltransferase [Limisphaerales bacterium]
MKAIIHPSQSSAQVDSQRAECLRQRIVAAKFLYETPRQADLWLKLHAQCAPSSDIAAPYQAVAVALAEQWAHVSGTLIALGCGGGEKDRIILNALPSGTHFVPTDVSEPLALKAAEAVPDSKPLIFDLAAAENLSGFIDQHAGPNRIFTFFGIIPNFPPSEILPQLRAILKSEDRLLLSANLAPNGMAAILSQYDNAPTRDWLAEFPRTHGAGEGTVIINIEQDGSLEHIAARFTFEEACLMKTNGEQFSFQPGDDLRLFVSYRYTQQSLSKILSLYGIIIERSFLSANREEGVFLCALQ